MAARTFCKSCCCSSFVENANSSSSMPASFVITCEAKTSRQHVLLFSLPWPYPLSSGFLSSGPQSRELIVESSSGQPRHQFQQLLSARTIVNDCEAGKVTKMLEKSAPNTQPLNDHLWKIHRDLGDLETPTLVVFPSCTRERKVPDIGRHSLLPRRRAFHLPAWTQGF